MKKIAVTSVLIGAALMVSTALFANDRAAAVQGMVERAVDLVKAEGKEAALKAINDLEGPFVIGEIYLFAISLDGVSLAEGSPNNKPLLGKNISSDPAVAKMIELAKANKWLQNLRYIFATLS